jgi:hypothetical protein
MNKKTFWTERVLKWFKVIREELSEFATRVLGIPHLGQESPLYEDMEDILERKKSGQLKFHTHDEIWNR